IRNKYCITKDHKNEYRSRIMLNNITDKLHKKIYKHVITMILGIKVILINQI
ncbi:hypothetical protein EHRUM1_05900, partial [Ehrlichia ruminantium]